MKKIPADNRPLHQSTVELADAWLPLIKGNHRGAGQWLRPEIACSPLSVHFSAYTPLGLPPSMPPVITVERTSISTLVAAVAKRLATRPMACLLADTFVTC